MNSLNQSPKQHEEGQDLKKGSKKIGLAILALSPLGLGMIWMVSRSDLPTRSEPLQSQAQLAQLQDAREKALLAGTTTSAAGLPVLLQQNSISRSALSVGTVSGSVTKDKANSPSSSLTTPPQPTLPSQANSTTPKGGAVPASSHAMVQPEGCFEITFKHKKVSSHSDGQACLQHQNLITLQHPKLGLLSALNPSSICVEVNGEVVKHKKVAGHTDQILIGPEAGPNATVTARGCIGKSQCSKKCVLKTDHFMSSLGMDESSDQTHKVGWNGSHQESQEDTALAKEVKDSHAMLSNASDSDAESVFNGWIADQYADLQCGKGGTYANQGIKLSQQSNH